jgi:hypothetical protein
VNLTPKLSLEGAKAVVAEATAPKVTEASIAAKIANVTFLRDDTLTICIITLKNGWRSTGKSAPASPENYSPDVGERYAYEDAFRPLWQLEGYALRERLSAEGR